MTNNYLYKGHFVDRTPLTLTVLAFPDAPATSITGPIEILTIAAFLAGAPKPVINIVTETDRPVTGLGDIMLSPTTEMESIQHTDILLIGSIGFPNKDTPACSLKTAAWLQSFEEKNIPIISICTGAFVLGEAGLLKHRNATTHWHFANEFRDRYPQAKLRVEQRVTCDENRYCTSGISGYSDVMMLIVEHFYGLFAREQAHQFIFGDTEQVQQKSLAIFVPFRQHDDSLIHRLQDWMHSNHHVPLSVHELSERIHLSERQMKRRFKQATGQTPIQYIQQIRVSIAKDKLEKTKHTIEEISREVGYEDVRYFRELFKKLNNMTPLEYRKHYQH